MPFGTPHAILISAVIFAGTAITICNNINLGGGVFIKTSRLNTDIEWYNSMSECLAANKGKDVVLLLRGAHEPIPATIKDLRIGTVLLEHGGAVAINEIIAVIPRRNE